MRKILFIVSEDWFFRSHFKALGTRARADGYEVLIAGRESGALAGEQVRVFNMPFARGGFRPLVLFRQRSQLQAVIDVERPDIIHPFSLKSITLTMLLNARGAARVFALTGRGYLALPTAPVWAKLVAWRFRKMLRAALDKPRSVLVVENVWDRAWVEGDRPLPEERVILMPGAGVETDLYRVTPEPASRPIVVGIVSRLIRSKGIDLAVAAIKQLRAKGLDITLRVAGDSDPENPEFVSEDELAQWCATPGVELVGRITDVPTFWAGVHIACLPSRGGEGLPRSMLEAAASGRPIVTTDAPGCGDFIADVAGIITPREDIGTLAAALETLARDATLRQRLSAGARARIEAGYTVQHAADQASKAWVLGQRP